VREGGGSFSSPKAGWQWDEGSDLHRLNAQHQWDDSRPSYWCWMYSDAASRKDPKHGESLLPPWMRKTPDFRNFGISGAAQQGESVPNLHFEGQGLGFRV
jgi:hypothetical protein